MKKLFALFMMMVMILSFSACGSKKEDKPSEEPAAESTEDAAEESTEEAAGDAATGVTLEDGKLMVAMEIGYPPMEYFDEDGTTPIGFDVEMSAELAKRMGLEIEVIDTAWDGIFAGLDSDRYDLVMSSCSITPSRTENYLMGKPYVQNAIELLVPKGSEIADIADVAGHSVAVQGETTSHDYLRDHETGCEIMDYDKVINCFDELKLGRVDAVLTDSVVAAYYLGEDIDKYDVVWVCDEAEPIGVTYKKGNEALCEAVDKVLDEMLADGTTAKIAEKYFGNADGVEGIR